MFSKELKEGTKKSHNAAENTKFISSFLKGVLDPVEYAKLLSNFYYVYSTMEECVSASTDPKVKNLHRWNATLFRTAFISRDLRYYYGPMWRELAKPSEACNTYCYRINEVAEKDPYLLIAHHYTRYIGDLSGGKILRGIAQKALNPPVGEGLHFYDFPEIDDKKEFKVKYRSGLDKVTSDSSKMNDIIAEPNYAFRLNMYLFDELSGTAKDAWNSAAKVFIQTMVGAITGKK